MFGLGEPRGMHLDSQSKPKTREYLNSRLFAVLFLSFSSGLPLVLIGSTLQSWYTVAGVSLVAIGALTLVGQPYVYKFLWAPIMDRFGLLGMGRRRGWILLTQFLLVLGIATIALMNPQTHPLLLAWVALAVAFASASQDVAIDAYRTDVLHVFERGIGAAVNTFGYRMAMLVAGALALIMAANIGWRATYFIMAALILFEMGITILSPRPEKKVHQPNTLVTAIINPLKQFFKRENAWLIVVFIIIYKLSDAFALALNTPFLIRGIGFTLQEIGIIYKLVGLGATVVGSLIGGWFLPRMGLYRALMIFGFFQAVSNLFYMLLALIGKSYVWAVASIFTEYFCSGLSTVAFIVFLMGLCDRRYTATQYAIFSALSAVGRVFVGPEAAIMVDSMGWALFYFGTFLFGMPALLLLWWLRRKKVDFSAEQVA